MTSERASLGVVLVGSLAMVVTLVYPLSAQEDTSGNLGSAPSSQRSEMAEMAQAMESMADMCRMMMQREMQQLPYRMAALIAVGVLLGVALVLLIILEVQWIRFWNLRIKSERQNLKR